MNSFLLGDDDLSVLCVQHMVKISYDVVKRWVNEAQEAASSDNIMVQVDTTDRLYDSCYCEPPIVYRWVVAPLDLCGQQVLKDFVFPVPRFGPVVSPQEE